MPGIVEQTLLEQQNIDLNEMVTMNQMIDQLLPNASKELQQKLKEISNTYIKSTDEDGNDNSKKVTISIDGTTLVESAFEQENSTGELQ